jgi:aldehyde dehydrogenase (NAD+)
MLYIDNQNVLGKGDAIEVINPATEGVVATVQGASREQVDEAVAAAKRAFESGVWADPEFRRSVMLRFAQEIEDNADELMDTLVSEIGTLGQLKDTQVNIGARFFRYNAQQAVVDRTRHLGFNSEGTAVNVIYYRPAGVVAAISAFNYPIFIGCAKSAAALAAGCSVILLPSPLAPLAVLKLGKLAERAGFPAGIFNILAGGAETGEALTGHPDIDKVTFTGSVEVGRLVMQQAAAHLCGSVLELGGKSAAIILAGADLERHVAAINLRYAKNAGQSCGAPTRILVHESLYDRFVELTREAYAKIKVGDPRDPATMVGPVITPEARGRLEQAIADAIAEGGHIIAGGGRPDHSKGYFINPTLIGGLDNQSKIAQTEVFGPLSVAIPFRTEQDAIDIANDSELGLKAYIYGPIADCLRIVPQLRVGTIQINGGSQHRPDAALTGYKNSGVGTEWGEDGLREFLRQQNVDCPFV